MLQGKWPNTPFLAVVVLTQFQLPTSSCFKVFIPTLEIGSHFVVRIPCLMWS